MTSGPRGSAPEECADVTVHKQGQKLSGFPGREAPVRGWGQHVHLPLNRPLVPEIALKALGWGQEKSRAAQDGGWFQEWAEAAEYNGGKHKISLKWAHVCATSIVLLKERCKQCDLSCRCMYSAWQGSVRGALAATNWCSLSLLQKQMSDTLSNAKKEKRNWRIYCSYYVNKNCARLELIAARTFVTSTEMLTATWAWFCCFSALRESALHCQHMFFEQKPPKTWTKTLMTETKIKKYFRKFF